MEQQAQPQSGLNETLTAEQLEKELVAKAAKQQVDPVSAAETMYEVYLPRLKMLVSRLSAKSLRRLIIGLIEVPIVQEEFRDKDKLAKESYELGDRLLQAKSMLILHTLAEYEKLQQTTKTEEEVQNVGTN